MCSTSASFACEIAGLGMEKSCKQSPPGVPGAGGGEAGVGGGGGEPGPGKTVRLRLWKESLKVSLRHTQLEYHQESSD